MDGIVEAAKMLDVAIRKTGLWHHYSVDLTGANGELTVTAYVFGDAGVLNDAVRSIYCEQAGILSGVAAEERFPRCFYIAVNAHYDVAGLVSLPAGAQKVASLAVAGLEGALTTVSAELCFGAGYREKAGESPTGDLIVSVDISRQCRVRSFYRGLAWGLAPVKLRAGDDMIDVFPTLASYACRGNVLLPRP